MIWMRARRIFQIALFRFLLFFFLAIELIYTFVRHNRDLCPPNKFQNEQQQQSTGKLMGNNAIVNRFHLANGLAKTLDERKKN